MPSKARRLLTLSFSGVLLLALIAGTGTLLVLKNIRAGEGRLRDQVLQRREFLEAIRTGIYLSGTLARDYFADPSDRDAPALLARLKDIEYRTNQAVQHTDPALQGEVAAYWKVLNLMEDMAAKRRTPALNAYFQRQLAQRRETMLQIAGDVDRAVQMELRQSETNLAKMYSRFQITLIVEIALILSFGLLLSISAIRRITTLQSQERALSEQLQSSQEAERRAIARELHDGIGQQLTRIRLDLGRVAALEPDHATRRQLQAISATAEEVVDSIRRIALSLRPSMLDDLGLVPALEWQAREVEARSGLNVEVEAEDSAGDLPESHRTCIYRVTQEALRNCARHAEASRVRIALEKQTTGVALQVEDNGRGFQAGRTKGLGMLGMEERVERLGGRFRVQSEPGRGTTIRAEFPL